MSDQPRSGNKRIIMSDDGGEATQQGPMRAADAFDLRGSEVFHPDIQNLDQPDIPKADIHVHIEGTIAPDIARMIAERNDVTLREGLFDSKGDYNWNGFEEFIKSYDDVAFALKTERDYMDVTYHFLKKWASLGCIYTEIIVSPNHADLIGLDRDAMMAGIYAGIDKAKGRFDIDARLNVTCLRHESPEMAEEVARYAAGINHPYVTGFNIAGGEREGDIKAYKNAFDIAHKAGLRMTAHLAEAASAQQVKDAMDLFPYLERIGHGVNMIYDPKILGEARRRGVTLEICPSSNVEIGIFKSFEEHPFRHLASVGPKVTINTDDPPFFNTDIQKEYELAATHFGMDDLALINVTRNAIHAAFCDDDTKELLLQKVRAAEKKTIEQSFPMRKRVPYLFGQSRPKSPRIR